MWHSLLFWSLLLVYAVLILSTVTIVVLENRQPAKTIAWIIVLIMLPVVGLAFFYFFGQNIRKERYISRRQYSRLTQRLLSDTHHLPHENPPAHYAPVVHLFERTNNAVLVASSGVSAYNCGADWLIALLRDIAAAQHTIHLETYIIEDDAVGRLVADALIDRAAAGVRVRLLYDDVGCWDVKTAFFRRLEEGGVDVAAFLPVRFPRLTHKVNYRNHRKMCIIDSRVGHIGGMNLAERYVSRRGRHWRDIHLRLTGGGVADMQRLFLTDWYFITADRHMIRETPLLQPSTDDATVADNLIQIVPSSPVSTYPEIMYGLTWVIQNARRYVYIQTPYFMPTDAVLQALETAALSGVDVRLMLPERPDSFWLRWGNDSYIATLLAAGIRVFYYTNGFLHSKSAVADDDWSTVGSSNMDFRSFENNFEANVFVYGHHAAEAMRRLFLDDQSHCVELLPAAWHHRPAWRRLLESTTRILSPLL